MSYTSHGLTKNEDIILGRFGMDDPELAQGVVAKSFNVYIPGFDFTPAVRSLTRKGYVEMRNEQGVDKYYLTIKGKELWKTRAKEEEEGRPHTRP